MINLLIRYCYHDERIMKTSSVSKKILIVAGPNGAGKTTLARELLATSSILYEFINADEIAKGLAPKHPESMALTASKLMIKRLKGLLEENKSFAFETTLSGTNYLAHLKNAKSKGYEIILFFLWLENHEQAVKRVAQRVKQGGHNIPEETIIRRYYIGLKNLLTYYLPLADMAVIVNNSIEESKNRLVARKGVSDFVDILNQDVWEKINKAANER